MVAVSVSQLQQVEINGVGQWLHIRGRDVTNPVLLFVHGGPGTPETVWLAHYNRDLANDFVVVAWEQRGAGKSYASGRADPAAMTLEQLIEDTLAVTAHLKERFGQERIFLVGHSWGTLLAVHAADRSPGDYHALVSVAQLAHTAREEAAVEAWLRARADAEGNRRALRQLDAAGAAEGGWSLVQLSRRLRWVDHYGGGVMHRPGARRELVGIMLRSRLYTPADKLRYLAAERFSLTHLYDELTGVDLFDEVPRLGVPIWFVHGRHDHQVPLAVTCDYFHALEAPCKRLVVFDDAAHSPLFEDPVRFHDLLAAVRAHTGHAVPDKNP